MTTGAAERAATLEGLVNALDEVTELIDALRDTLERQRAGVAAGNPGMVDDSTQVVTRSLLSLEEVRRRLLRITGALARGLSTPLDVFDPRSRGIVPPSVVEAQQRVQRAADRTMGELHITQTVLRRAIEDGNAFLQQLFAGNGDGSGEEARGDGIDPPRARRETRG